MKKELLKIAGFIAVFVCVIGVGAAAYQGLTIENNNGPIYLGGGEGQSLDLGGTTNFDELDVTDGYKVDGTTVIDGSGNVDAPITSTTGTFSSTLDVSGATTLERLTEGATILASSTSNSAETLLVADLITYSQLDYTPGDAAVTLTLPATSTMTAFIPNAGDKAYYIIRNLDAVAATSTTIAAGTGIDLVENENGDVVIEGGNQAYLRFKRELDTDVTVSVDEYIAAD